MDKGSYFSFISRLYMKRSWDSLQGRESKIFKYLSGSLFVRFNFFAIKVTYSSKSSN